MSNAESGFDLFVVRQPGTFYDSKPDQDAAGLLGGHASFFITLSGVFFFFFVKAQRLGGVYGWRADAESFISSCAVPVSACLLMSVPEQGEG